MERRLSSTAGVFKKCIFLFLLLLNGCRCNKQNENELHLAIWSNYLPEEIINNFTQTTGIKIKFSNYSSNEELLAKLQAGAALYDLAIPSDYMVHVMAKLNLLHPLEKEKITQLKFLDPKFLKKEFDPENTYSLPYGWTTTGIVINKNYYKNSITSWHDLLTHSDLHQHYSLLDDSREALGIALKSLGYSINTVNPSELEKAKTVLSTAHQHVLAFSSEPLDPIRRGEVWAAHAYSSDALQAGKNPSSNIEFIIPKEGGTLAIDNFVIPQGAKNLDAAYQFINFMLTKEVNASLVKNVFIGPTILEVDTLLSDELKQNKSLFPAPEILSQCEMIHDLGDDIKLWEKIWTEIKAGG